MRPRTSPTSPENCRERCERGVRRISAQSAQPSFLKGSFSEGVFRGHVNKAARHPQAFSVRKTPPSLPLHETLPLPESQLVAGFAVCKYWGALWAFFCEGPSAFRGPDRPWPQLTFVASWQPVHLVGGSTRVCISVGCLSQQCRPGPFAVGRGSACTSRPMHFAHPEPLKILKTGL